MGDAYHALGKIPASGSVNKNIRSLQIVVCPCKCRTTATAKKRRGGKQGSLSHPVEERTVRPPGQSWRGPEEPWLGQR